MIRSSKTSLKFANKCKKESVHHIIDEYKDVLSQLVDILWVMEDIPNLITYEITDQIETELSARMVQCAAKQASGIVRGTREKQRRRLFIIKWLTSEGKFKQARKLQRIYDDVNITKPTINNVEMELDSRFVEVEFDRVNSFDGWVTISSIGNQIKLEIPFKKTVKINKFLSIGKMKNGIRVSKKNITLMFEFEGIENTSTDNVTGIDIGVNSLLSIDYGNEKSQSIKNNHGHDLNSINDRLSRKKKGSNGFRRTITHRTNYINHSINQLNWTKIGTLKIEKIRNLRRGRRTSRKLQHFVYKQIFDKLKSNSERYNVCINEVDPTYTSQRCSCCGWTRKSNRKGLSFKCGNCSHEQNSDMNASSNIRLNLPEIGKKERLKRLNRKGFFWNVVSHEPIVRDVKKTKS